MSQTVLELIKFVKENKDLLKGNPVLVERIQNVLRKANGYGDDPDDEDWENQGFSVIDPDQQEEDEADKWLREAEEKKKQETETKQVPTKAKPSEADIAEAVEGHKKAGFNNAEANYWEGNHDYSNDFDQALRGKLNKEIDSPAMWKLFAKHSSAAMNEFVRKEQERAELEKNPMKYAAGQASKASAEAHGDFDDAYHEHINNPDHENMSLEELHAAMNEFHDKRDPAEADKIAAAGEKASTAALEARKAHATGFQERLRDFMMGGHAQGIGSGTRKVGGADITEQTAMQEAGSLTAGEADPEAKFATSHADYVRHLTEEQQSRLKRINHIKNASTAPTKQGGVPKPDTGDKE